MFTLPFGSITSPNFPGHYDSNLDCVWTIKASYANDRIIVTTDAFDVNDTSSAQCKDTYVEIGDKGAHPHTYCNEMRPYHSLESMTSEVIIRFKTSAANHTSHGFIFYYEIRPGARTTIQPSPTPSSGKACIQEINTRARFSS